MNSTMKYSFLRLRLFRILHTHNKKEHIHLERRKLIYPWIALTMEIADFSFLDIDMLYYTQSKTSS